MLRTTFALCLSVPATLMAQTLPDPAVCATGDQWMQVGKDFIIALPAAHAAGKLTDQQFTDLSIWTTQMQTYLINTNNTQAFCEQFLLVRKAWGF